MHSKLTTETIITRLLNGSRRALARALTIVENQSEGVDQLISSLYPHTGNAWIVGITGAPGTGKSSLVNALTKAIRTRDMRVGIIAVDPTSPFTGGAILGDRIRMNDLAGDKDVFIRSMATRGSLGGLSQTTRDAVRVMDAARFDVIIVETVGAGQSEVDIVQTAHTTIVVEAPGLGDDVQAIKAGILEIADLLVVNKADRIGADQTARALKMMVEMGHPSAREELTNHHGHFIATKQTESPITDEMWIPQIMRTISIDGTGIEELVDQIFSHRDFLIQSKSFVKIQNRGIEIELYERLQNELMKRLSNQLTHDTIKSVIHRIREKEIDPQSAIGELLQNWSWE